MKHKHKLLISALFLILISPMGLLAVTGIKPIGFSPRYVGMGGTATAVGGSIADLESNPAHLADLERTILDISIGLGKPTIQYADEYIDPNIELAYNNKVKSELLPLITLPTGGIMGKLSDRIGWGLALYVQGGVGASYEGIVRNTPGEKTIDQVLGTSDSLPLLGQTRHVQESYYTYFGYFKLTPGMGIKLGNKLRLGLGLDLGYAWARFRYTYQDPTGSVDLPGTGFNYKSDPAYTFSGKIGLVYKPTDNLKLAYAYRSRSRIYLDGRMSVNTNDANYWHENRVSAYIEWPDVHSAGISYKLGSLLLAFDVDYIRWSSAMRSVEFKIDEAWIANPLGFFNNELAFALHWRDQPVYKIGLEYELKDIVLRGGYAYSPPAVGPTGINPLFPVTTKQNVTLGLGFKGERWDFDFALDYGVPNRIEGSQTSDWALLHSVAGSEPSQIKVAQYSQSQTLTVVILYMGFRLKM